MNSDLPKVLHPLAGAPLLVHAMRSGAAVKPARTVVVTGYGGKDVAAAAHDHDPEALIAVQQKAMGTGHAALQARAALSDFEGDAVVLFGDTPFVRPQTIAAMLAARRKHAIVVLGFEAADPKRYGRLVMRDETLERIVEHKDATPEDLSITICNGGVIAADSGMLFDLLSQVTNANANGEFYLTDIVALARARGLSAGVVVCDEAETQGINTRVDLAEAEATLQSAMRRQALENGVTLVAPETVFFCHDTVIGRDALIEANVVFGPGVTIESGALIRAFSHLEGCHVARDAIVGPYARLRPGAELSEGARVGNFVEVKNATLAEGVKVNHL
ncbi:MAG: NTP transferase domain-containing protein, partial [Halocynthiibacter sp.]